MAEQEEAEVQVIEEVKLDDLIIHPTLLSIYRRNKREEKVLAKSMAFVGQLEPITLNYDNQIISGAKRYRAAYDLRWKTIKAIRISVPKEKEEEIIVFHNQQRKKRWFEIIKEAEVILGLLGKNQGVRKDLLKEGEDNPFGKIGKDRFERAAEMMGGYTSATSLRRLMDVVDFERESDENKELGLVAMCINDEITPYRAFKMMKDFLALKKEREARKKLKIKAINSDDFKIYNKSSDKMSEVGKNSVQVVFTSPPYYNLRFYNNNRKGKPELGQEKTPTDFVNNLSRHFRDVKRVLKPTGSFFLNIGETYNNGENLLIPTRLLLNLCDKEGWFLVNEIIWQKTNPIPQGNGKRLQPTYEKIFHLVKDPEKYYYEEFKLWNDNKVKVVKAPKNRRADSDEQGEDGFTLTRSYQKFKDFIKEQTVRAVITGTNAASRQSALKAIDSKTDHPALMPDYLPIIPILTTSKIGDIILDPFSGSGTTGRTALMLGRKYVGYEFNKKNYELSLLDLSSAIKEISEEGIKAMQS